ncbi:N-acetylglucosamine kinase [Streptomyces triticiradicis]|uniref:ATPase n=1 Tax=Streptomyces triticiradicis TaxID=2651189 RepID=A0A7J5D587_9ACTN|nr:BadF/BadG/BcrA/BcrD ATPase family protein [Streptomyces triticiradicis]KAB1979423.1 ATPase [Streptomyces triticiradicis]
MTADGVRGGTRDGRGPSVVLAVDSGGSGLRAALAAHAVPGDDRPPVRRGAPARPHPAPLGAPLTSREPVRTGPRGISAEHLLEQLLPMARRLMADAGAERLGAVAVGAAGLATLGDELRDELPPALERELGVRRLALAADAVTAYTGALGARAGAVIAAGTGMIAIGTDLTSWHRADGWGHLLGDCGGGAWIGRAGLEAALRAFDGRPEGSAALLARAEEVFGPVPGLPGLLYPRTDRAAVLASFAPEVAGQAGNDPVASRILRTAARHMAESAAAVCPAGGEPRLALTGGVFDMGAALLGPLAEELAVRLPHARHIPALGGPLDGALRIAADLADGRLALPPDERMLYVVAEKPYGQIHDPNSP